MYIWIILLLWPVTLYGGNVQTTVEDHRIDFVKEILTAQSSKHTVTLSLRSDNDLRPEGFRITRQDDQINITSNDPAGLMYGGLEIAELLRSKTEIKPSIHNPHMQMRGTKFNIPLDARTPSYSDASDVAQHNLPVMWDFQFWKDYLDLLAHSRYNFVSLWSLHPFPSLVKVPGYEKIALDDVWRSRTIKNTEDHSLWGVELATPEILEKPEIVKEISIDDKIAFWKKVMAYGKSRNISFYFVTWNIFTNGTFGQYGITDQVDNKTTRDYFRKSVTQMFVTYPDLAGIGLTTGENMHKLPLKKKEEWAFETYGKGVLDAAKALPGRKIRFIHRQHQASSKEILKTFQPLVDHPDIDFIFSFKYAKAHVYSATKQHYHQKFVEDLKPSGVKTIWTLRNDSAYYFRWGAPDFVREFIKNIPKSVTQGYYLGSDQWVWGRDFLHHDNSIKNTLELKKHEYQWMLWGRLAYDPELPDQRITHWLATRYDLQPKDAQILRSAWQTASMIYPLVTGFHWGVLDFKWYPEASVSRKKWSKSATGFHDVNRFITLPPHPMADAQSIPDFINGKVSDKSSPLQVADQIDQSASQATSQLSKLQRSDPTRHLRNDIITVSELGRHYADKIRGATHLARFRMTKDPTDQQQAIASLVKAAIHWKHYTELTLKTYKNPIWMNRVGIVDLQKNYLATLTDIRIAGGDPQNFGLPKNLETPKK